MASFHQLYNEIKSNIEIATILLDKLSKEKQRLEEEIDKKDKVIEELTAEIDTLKNKNKIVNITNTILYKEDKKETIKKINEYVREIDNCIGILNSMEWTKKEQQ